MARQPPINATAWRDLAGCQRKDKQLKTDHVSVVLVRTNRIFSESGLHGSVHGCHTVTANSRDEVKTRGKTWVVFFQIRDQWISCASEFLAPNFSKVSSLYFFWSCFMCSGGFFFFFLSHHKIINKALRNKCQPSVEALFWKVRSHFDVLGYLMFDITKMKIWN